MTDFTEETRIVCAQSRSFSAEIEGSKGDLYPVTFNEANPGEYQCNWHCTCLGFQHRKACRHVEQAKGLKCDAGEDAYAGGSGLGDVDQCPKCGGPVTIIKILT